MKGFTKCSKGHYYKEELKSCPYCSGENVTEAGVVSENAPTQVVTQATDDGKTKLVGGFAQTPVYPSSDSRTVFGDEVLKEIGGKEVSQVEIRTSRMLTGWLVSYSFDRMGADFRLYEGRNIIGRDADCNITVHDPMISGKHAVILFKNGKYKVKDELSSHGTWLNDKDIEDEHVELHDGDLIRMGETVFKFKSSL
ncbi:MAG: FHA domain-containing protein [Prevotellaceae bacterium]|jgi:hypothetical protein|nr:FHA domain-containing protein [Prevotellaceae bacterium]